jgi:glutamate/tyrosine decarboxylase-like PLP-dependent enzyme
MQTLESTRGLLASAAERAIRYLEQLPSRRVAPEPGAIAGLAALDAPLPEAPADAGEVLELLDTSVSPATMATAGPRFFGFVIGGSLPAALAANWLAGAWDQNSALYKVTPGTALLESVSLRWVLELLGLPATCAGAFVTGATMANFTALAAARGAVLRKAGWNVEAQGLFGAPPITVIVGEEAHPTLFKSIGLLGLGRSRLTHVPVDAQGRLRPAALPKLSGPTILCLQAGNVNTGAFDPIGEICSRFRGDDHGDDHGDTRADNLWVHVDGAFGLWAAAAPGRSHLTAGLAQADSWATDAHKWLNVPYDSGLALVKDAQALKASMAITAEYLPTESPNRNPADFTPELSRRARGVEIWAALRSLGRSGLSDLVERTCRHASRFAQGLAAAGHRVLNEVALNQVLVSFGSPEVTRAAIAALQEDGTCWCGETVWQGQTAMRISVSSWATTREDVERSLQAMLRAASRTSRPAR